MTTESRFRAKKIASRRNQRRNWIIFSLAIDKSAAFHSKIFPRKILGWKTQKRTVQRTVLKHAAGGKKGIRTLERVLAVTRFPIVRLRPAQPSFHIFNFYIIPQLSPKVKHFFRFFSKYVKPGHCPANRRFCERSLSFSISACSDSADSAGSADSAADSAADYSG